MQQVPRALGLDFGTTNSVAALAAGGESQLVEFAGEQATGAVFRSALCFWHDEAVKGGMAHEAGPWAIAEYMEYPEDSRFLQSFKSVAASAIFLNALPCRCSQSSTAWTSSWVSVSMTSYAVPRDGEMKMWFVSSSALFRDQHCPMALLRRPVLA